MLIFNIPYENLADKQLNKMPLWRIVFNFLPYWLQYCIGTAFEIGFT